MQATANCWFQMFPTDCWKFAAWLSKHGIPSENIMNTKDQRLFGSIPLAYTCNCLARLQSVPPNSPSGTQQRYMFNVPHYILKRPWLSSQKARNACVKAFLNICSNRQQSHEVSLSLHSDWKVYVCKSQYVLSIFDGYVCIYVCMMHKKTRGLQVPAFCRSYLSAIETLEVEKNQRSWR